MDWLYLAVAFAFGGFTAYQDIDNFFSSRRIGHQGYRHLPSLLFLMLNGIIAAAFLRWALASDGNSPINKVIQVDSAIGKTLAISFIVPSLLRSKLFEVGEGKQAVGIAAAYDWVRDKVLHSLNSYTADIKERLAIYYAGRLAKHKDLPDRLREWVSDEIKPFDPGFLPEIDREFDRYKARLAESDYPYEKFLQDLIRWAMDNAGIPRIERRLKLMGRQQIV